MSAKLLLSTNGIDRPENSNVVPPDSVTGIITNGFFAVDKDWIVKSWNTAAEKLLRVPAKDIIGKNLWDTFAGALPVLFYTTYCKTLLRNIPARIKEYWPQMHAWFDVLTFYNKDCLSFSFKSSKILPPEYPEKQLKVLNELYRFVSEITNDCLWEWNVPAKEIFWIDGGHKKAFGYQIENALIPRHFWENRLHPDDKVRVLAGINRIVNESLNPVWEDEYRFRKADNEYAYVHDRGHIIRGEGNVAVRVIGATQDITARKLSEIKLLEERQTKQREITSAVITAQENEREEIGRELHDNLNQVLAVTKLYIEMASSDSTNKEMYLGKSLEFITNVIREVRKISRKMIIPGVHGLNLLDNIRNLMNDLAGIHPVKFEFKAHRVEGRLPEGKLQLNIYRIIQEQVINILKHSEATDASINLTRLTNEIVLEIIDNGKGCDISQLGNGVGIRNIMGRAELCNGIVEIVSKPGEGFLLKITFQYS